MGRTGKNSQREAEFHTGPVASEETLMPWAPLTGNWTVSWCSAERTPWRGATGSTLVGIEIHRQSRQDAWGENEARRTVRKKEEAEENHETDESWRWRQEATGRDA